MNNKPLQFADGGIVDNTRPSNKLFKQIETLEKEKTDLMERDEQRDQIMNKMR